MPNLALRVLSAVVLIPPLLLLVFLSPNWLFAIAVSLVAAMCGFEYGTITFGKSFPKYRLLPAFFSFVMALSLSLFPLYHLSPVIGLALVSLFIPVFFMFSVHPQQETLPISVFTTAGSIYSGVLIGFISLLYISNDFGSHWVFALLLSTFLGDTLAYTFGRLFGRRKLAPRISPGKTWAGAFGGLLGALLAMSLAKYFFLSQLSWLEVLLISVPLNISCQLGDLAESFLKRAFDVKDSGNIIPGHGGILDRVDALMFGAPVLFFFSVVL